MGGEKSSEPVGLIALAPLPQSRRIEEQVKVVACPRNHFNANIDYETMS
jgi:hypothetical protein